MTDTPAPTAPQTLEDRVAAAEAYIAKFGPLLEELAETAAKAADQGHSFGSILGAIALQLLGVKL